LEWLRKNIPLPGILSLYNDSSIPFNVHGGTDIVVMNDYDIIIDLVSESIYAVLELKVKRKHMMQFILLLI